MGKKAKKKSVRKKTRCAYCKKRDLNPTRLKLHEDKCKIGQVYIDQSKRKKKKLITSPTSKDYKWKVRQCPYCDAKINNSTLYELHMSSCERFLSKKQSIDDSEIRKLRNHVKNCENNLVSRENNGIDEKLSSDSSQQSESSISEFNNRYYQNQQFRTPQIYYKCPYCNRGTRSIDYLVQHLYDLCKKNPKNTMHGIKDRLKRAIRSRKEGSKLKMNPLNLGEVPLSLGVNFSEKIQQKQLQEIEMKDESYESEQILPAFNICVSEKNTFEENLNSTLKEINRLIASLKDFKKSFEIANFEAKLSLSLEVMDENKDQFYNIIQQKLLQTFNCKQLEYLDQGHIKMISEKALKELDLSKAIEIEMQREIKQRNPQLIHNIQRSRVKVEQENEEMILQYD